MNKLKVKRRKTEKGITLIALIITIVVLLILAVVAIRAVTGDGILQHAKNAQTEYQTAQGEENTTLQSYLDKIEANVPEGSGTELNKHGIYFNKMYVADDGDEKQGLVFREDGTVEMYMATEGSNYVFFGGGIVDYISYSNNEVIYNFGEGQVYNIPVSDDGLSFEGELGVYTCTSQELHGIYIGYTYSGSQPIVSDDGVEIGERTMTFVLNENNVGKLTTVEIINGEENYPSGKFYNATYNNITLKADGHILFDADSGEFIGGGVLYLAADGRAFFSDVTGIKLNLQSTETSE